MDDLVQNSETSPKAKTPKEFARELAGRRPTKAALREAVAHIAALERELKKTQQTHTPPPGSITKVAAYTVKDAATLLGMSISGVYMAINRKQLPAIKVGGKILILKAVLDRMLGIED